MLLEESKIKEILERKPFNIDWKEQNSIIQTYIKEKRGMDCGEIQAPTTQPCPSFMNLMFNKRVNPAIILQKGDEILANEFCFYIAANFYISRWNEI